MGKEYDNLKLESQLCFPLYAAARKVTGKYTPYFKEIGITYTQYIVLMVLWASEEERVTVGEICEKLYLDSGTITPLLKKMEDKGWIKRERSKDDERIVLVSLTKEGWKLRDKCKDIPAKLGSCIKMKREDAENLYRILYQLLEEL